MRFWIDGHNLTIVSRDGIEIKPIYNVKYLTIPVGQRVDVIVHCNQKSTERWTIYASIATGWAFFFISFFFGI